MNKHVSAQRAKVFWSGRSQAVRIPKDFRFDTDEVSIRREGRKVILEPSTGRHEDGWAWLDRLSGNIDPDFEAAALEEQPWGSDDPEAQRSS